VIKTAIKIEWSEPTDTNITLIRIDSSATKFGTYTTLTDTLAATSDGNAKTAANTWVVSYIDSVGTFTTWYKLKFFDGTNSVWSEFSDALTGYKDANICSIDDVKGVLDTVGRWTDTEIQNAIEDIEVDMKDDMGTPIQSVWSYAGYDSITATTYKTYYTGEENIYKVDRVFVGTTTRHELFLDDSYKVHKAGGMIRILPFASSGFIFTKDSTLEIRFTPKIYNRVATYRTAKFLLERLDTISRGTPSTELTVINNRLDTLELRLQHKIGVVLSSDLKTYDPVYGTNKTFLRQNHDRNKFIASYGWN